jgi:hypothetical protein
MNYSGATINFYDLPTNVRQSEEVECWIVENTEHRLSDIHYMTGEEIEVINH